MINNKIAWLAIIMGLWICSCVEPVEFALADARYLTVDATLTDGNEEQTFSITESVTAYGAVNSVPVTKATVTVLVDGTEKIALKEKSPGIYALPSTFRTKVGSSYRLIFQKADGTAYESSEEKMTPSPKIDRIYDEFVIKGVQNGTNFYPANYIYIDLQDPPSEKNNYVWSWKLWERQMVCRTVDFDYYCRSECWEILYNKDFNTFSDVYTNGKYISGRLIAKIPFYQYNGALLEIKQKAVSKQAFQYLNLLADQALRTGSLVDTPAAAIIGNIKNLSNPNEAVAGFFMATSTLTTKYWLNREKAIGKAEPVGLLWRSVNPDPMGITYPCIASPFRTPIQPEGWIR